MTGYPLDLVVLVADLDQEQTIRGLLDKRSKALGIRELKHSLLRHPRRDPGCFNEAPDVLQSYQDRAAQALVVLDRDGCGQEATSAEGIESDLNIRLASSGWGERAKALVIDPELEIWVWSDSPHVESILGWAGKNPSLREWLSKEGLWSSEQPKPSDPKEALRVALRQGQKRAGAALFGRLAELVSIERCQDASFARLRGLLTAWFASR
jgi:hypothetical protein